MPLAFTNWTLYFFTKWLFCIFGSMPSRFSTQYVSGISDSPMWNRGKRSRSNSATLLAALGDEAWTAVEPAGPPPITIDVGRFMD